MPYLDAVPEPWRSFLSQLDEAVGEEVRFVCMGGFVVTQLYGFSRPTADIDTLSIVPRDQGAVIRELGAQGGPLHAKYKVYFDFVAVASVPEDYEERLTEMFPQVFRHLRLFALDPYDLALSKLERNIQRDRDDVRFLARTIPFDLEILQERYRKELRWQLGNPTREDLTLKLWIEAIQEERTQ
ncbi:MAG: DUF6036 family nucleotidyltransferase [Candidatus Acidiferrales bacterium]